MGTRIDLNGTWKLRWHDTQRGDCIERLTPLDADLSRAWDVMVPGEVHQDLVRLGVIPEPATGLNLLQSRWVEETVWHYRRTFEAPALANGERAFLRFEGLDLGATIYLNGKQIGSHANAFYPCCVEATEALRPGTNVLIVRIESGLFYAAEKPTLDLENNTSCITKRPWLRKTQSSHSWDWSPRLLNVGITGNVHLDIVHDVRWDGAAAVSDLHEDLQAGHVMARAFVEGLGKEPITGTLIARIAETGQTIPTQVTIQPGPNRLEVRLPVEHPELWWPVGHGRQPLYLIEIKLEVNGAIAGQAQRRIGFRQIRVNQDPHPVSGRYFVVEINHKPVFCKGGNFVPADILFNRIDAKRYTTLVDRALESNCNFLRIWGGGLYESDRFYELCDEKGILVWQEFIFACCRYPGTDTAFYHDVKREATYQIRRLAHHPSLIIWCGNNEMEMGAADWGWDQRGQVRPDHAIFHHLLPWLLQEEDSTRYYQPSSPCTPDYQHPCKDDAGDQHPWSVGFGDTDFRKYREMICRFADEGGMLGPNSLPTVLACLPKEMQYPGSFAWEQHDNSVSSWGISKPFPDVMLDFWLGKKIAHMSIEDYVYWGGVVQGMGLADYVRNFRRRMFDSAAAVFWMYNDCWPTVRSWTIVDYYLRRTPAFWPVRRAFAPVAVAVVREGDKVVIYGINEGAELQAELRYGIIELTGSYPVDQRSQATLKANSSTPLAEFDARSWDELGQQSHVAFALLHRDGREIARDSLILPLLKEMQWPQAHVRVHMRHGQAVFESDSFAWRVCLDLNGETPLPDNFFDVYPGVPTVLPWSDALGEPKILHVGNALAHEPLSEQKPMERETTTARSRS